MVESGPRRYGRRQRRVGHDVLRLGEICLQTLCPQARRCATASKVEIVMLHGLHRFGLGHAKLPIRRRDFRRRDGLVIDASAASNAGSGFQDRFRGVRHGGNVLPVIRFGRIAGGQPPATTCACAASGLAGFGRLGTTSNGTCRTSITVLSCGSADAVIPEGRKATRHCRGWTRLAAVFGTANRVAVLNDPADGSRISPSRVRAARLPVIARRASAAFVTVAENGSRKPPQIMMSAAEGRQQAPKQ